MSEVDYRERAERASRELDEVRAAARNEHIAKVAERMGFRDPEDVIGRVSADDALTDFFLEEALRGIAASSPHLMAPPVPPSTPDGKPLIQSVEDWEKLPDAEQMERMGEVEAVMRGEAVPPAPLKAPLRSLDEWEALPRAERMARMDEADQLILEGEI